MTYTNKQINEAIKKAIADKGEDYIYPKGEHASCYYSQDGEPSCIVGHVLHTLDPEMFEKVAAWEKSPESDDLTFGAVASDLDLPFHYGQVYALLAAQEIQDQGRPWGQAAQEYARLLGEQL